MIAPFKATRPNRSTAVSALAARGTRASARALTRFSTASGVRRNSAKARKPAPIAAVSMPVGLLLSLGFDGVGRHMLGGTRPYAVCQCLHPITTRSATTGYLDPSRPEPSRRSSRQARISGRDRWARPLSSPITERNSMSRGRTIWHWGVSPWRLGSRRDRIADATRGRPGRRYGGRNRRRCAVLPVLARIGPAFRPPGMRE